MKKFIYGIIALIIILLGLNTLVRVTPNDEGIIIFWLTQKLSAESINPEFEDRGRIGWSAEERVALLGHMTNSIESNNAVEKFLRQKLASRETMTKEDTRWLITTLNSAISEASIVPNHALRKVHPDLPKYFRDKYQLGLKKIVKGLTQGDEKEFARGAQLIGEFKAWGLEHQMSFQYPPK